MILRTLDRAAANTVARGIFDIVKGAILVVCAVLLQVAVVVDFPVVGGRPDVVVILVVAVALLRGPLAGAATGFAAGFLIDTLGLGLVGISSFVLVGVGWLIGIWGERMSDRAAVRPLVAVACASFGADLASLTVAVLLGAGPSIEPSFISAAIIGAMLNVLLAIPLYPLIRRILRRRAPEPVAALPTIAADTVVA